METKASKQLARMLDADSWMDARDFAFALLRAAEQHPLIKALRPDDPARVAAVARRVQRWAAGEVSPSRASRTLVQLATGGRLVDDRRGLRVEGGSITPEMWSEPVDLAGEVAEWREEAGQ